MTRNVLKQLWRKQYLVNVSDFGSCPSTQCNVPPLLAIVLRVLKVQGILPGRFQWNHSGWLVTVSPGLAIFQRLFIILSSALFITSLIINFWVDQHGLASNIILTKSLWLIEIVLVFGIVYLKAFTGRQGIEQLMDLLKRIKQDMLGKKHVYPSFSFLDKDNVGKIRVKNGVNHYSSSIKSQRSNKIKLIWYIVWIYAMHIVGLIRTIITGTEKYISSALYGILYYMSTVVVLLKLQWSLTVTEVISTHTALNNQIERLLESSYITGTVNSNHGQLAISHLAQCFEIICDVVVQLEKDSEIFLFLTFMLMLTYLLITPYNFIAIIANERSIYTVKKTLDITEQGIWSFFHISELLIIIEPCHWMLKQTERTRDLLVHLRRQAKAKNDRVSREIDLFLLEVQVRCPEMAPMGVFTISRQLVSSIIHWTATYVVIIVQMQTVEMLTI